MAAATPAATTPAMDNCADVHLHTHGMGERGHTSPHCLLKPTTTRSGGRRLRGRASSGTLRVMVERRLAGRPDVSAFLTLDEQKQLLNQQKLAAERGGSKQPVRIPYASVPWQQALETPVKSELNPAVVARQLTIALICDSQEYTSAVDQLMRQPRANEVENIKNQFSAAYSAGVLARVQLAGEQVRRHCTTEMEGILARANGAIASSARFPRESAFWEVTEGRTIQSQQLPTFLSTLSSKIVGDGDTINEVQIAVPLLRSARPWENRLPTEVGRAWHYAAQLLLPRQEARRQNGQTII